ncbi:MAG: hypothetical protein SVU32_02910 [Candidatus Nanohaloarchaea archaeon]|nr:hypothetical protein [Candidatus Nanohaloarchaea archaeon]
MTRTVTIEVEEGQLNTNSDFDLATTIVILEKVSQQLVQRSQIEKQQPAGDDGSEEEEEADED